MNKAQLLEAINKLPKNPIEWDTAILADKIKPILLALIDQVPTNFETEDITALTAEQLDAMKVGDVVVKITGKQKHLYHVSYKGDGAGEGLCITYVDASVVETVSYDRTDSGWAYNSTDKTPLNP